MDVAQVNDTQATFIFLWSWQELDLPSEVLNYAPKNDFCHWIWQLFPNYIAVNSHP